MTTYGPSQVILTMVLARLQADRKKINDLSGEERQRYIDEAIDEAIEDYAIALSAVAPEDAA